MGGGGGGGSKPKHCLWVTWTVSGKTTSKDESYTDFDMYVTYYY